MRDGGVRQPFNGSDIVELVELCVMGFSPLRGARISMTLFCCEGRLSIACYDSWVRGRGGALRALVLV